MSQAVGEATSFFLSYAREDVAFRHKLQQAMLAAGRRVWVDEDMARLTFWREEVRAGILRSDVFVFLLSPDSLRSEACRSELAIARSVEKRVAPIEIRDVEGLHLFDGLGDPNWVLFLEPQRFEASLAELLVAADTDYDWLKTHTRLALRAEDWLNRDRDESLLLRGRDLEAALAWVAQAATPGHGEASSAQVEYLDASREREAAENTHLREQYARAVARQLAFSSELERGSSPRSVEVSALLAAESLTRWRTFEGDQAMRRALSQLPVRPRQTTLHPDGRVVASTPDGGALAVGGDERITLWPRGAAGERHELGADGSAVWLGFDDGGTRLLALDEHHHGWLWRVDDASLVTELSLAAPAEHVAMHTDSDVVAVAGGLRLTVYDGEGAAVLNVDQPGEVRALALLNQADLLVAVCAKGNAGSLRLFDLTSGEALEAYPLGGYARRAAFAPGGTFLAVMAIPVGPWMGPARDFTEVRVLNLAEEGLPAVVLRHQHPVRWFGFSGEGGHVVTVTDRTVGVWRADDGQPLGSVARASDPTRVAFREQGTRLATAYVDGTVRITELVTGEQIMALNRHALSLAFEPGGSLVVSEAGRTELWGDEVGLEVIKARPGVPTQPSSAGEGHAEVAEARFSLAGFNAHIVGFSPEGRTLLVEGPGDLATLLDTEDRSVKVLDLSAQPGRSDFTADGRHLATVSNDATDATVRVRELDTGEVVQEYDRPASPHFKLSARGGLIVHASGQGEQVWVRDSLTGHQRHHVTLSAAVSGLAFSDSGGHLAMVTEDHRLIVLDVLSGSTRTYGPIAAAYPTALADDGSVAILADHTAWNLASGTELRPWDDPAGVRATVLAPGGRVVAVLPESGAAQLRHLPSMATVRTVGRQQAIGAAFLGTDHVATVEVDDTLHVWRLDDGVEVMPPIVHPDETRTPFVDPTGTLVATGCNDGWVRVWQWRVADLVAEARGRVDHDLDPAERSRLLPDEREDPASDPGRTGTHPGS